MKIWDIDKYKKTKVAAPFLGLLWKFILHYQIKGGGRDLKQEFNED